MVNSQAGATEVLRQPSEGRTLGPVCRNGFQTSVIVLPAVQQSRDVLVRGPDVRLHGIRGPRVVTCLEGDRDVADRRGPGPLRAVARGRGLLADLVKATKSGQPELPTYLNCVEGEGARRSDSALTDASCYAGRSTSRTSQSRRMVAA